MRRRQRRREQAAARRNRVLVVLVAFEEARQRSQPYVASPRQVTECILEALDYRPSSDPESDVEWLRQHGTEPFGAL